MSLEALSKLLPTFTTEEIKKWEVRGRYAVVALTIGCLALATWKFCAMATAAEAAVTLAHGKYWFTVISASDGAKIGALYGLAFTSGIVTAASALFSMADIYEQQKFKEFFTAVAGAIIVFSFTILPITTTIFSGKCWYHHGRVYTQL